jgi:hypothetical protein
VLYTVVSGIWNVFARLGLPVIALLAIVTVARPQAGLLSGAIAGLVLLALMALGFGLVLRSESFAIRAGAALQPALAVTCRLALRPPPSSAAGSLLGFRDRAAGLLAARGWRITAATAASNLALWLVLMASLRGVGLSQSQVPWQTSFAAFAFVRLLTVLPVTPGGAGIAELGLVGILASGADHRVAGQVTAAVLVYRAVTYLAPIPIGALACLAWWYAPALRRRVVRSGTTPGHGDEHPLRARVECVRDPVQPRAPSAGILLARSAACARKPGGPARHPPSATLPPPDAACRKGACPVDHGPGQRGEPEIAGPSGVPPEVEAWSISRPRRSASFPWLARGR